MPRLRPAKMKCSGVMVDDAEQEQEIDKTKLKLRRDGTVSGTVKYESYGKCEVSGRWNSRRIIMHHDVDYGEGCGVYNYHWKVELDDEDHFVGEYYSDQGSRGRMILEIRKVEGFSSSDEFSDGGFLFGPSKCKCTGVMIDDDEQEQEIKKTKIKIHRSGKVSGKIDYDNYGKCKIHGSWDGDTIELHYDLDYGEGCGIYNYHWNIALDGDGFTGEYTSDQGSCGFLRLEIFDVDEFTESEGSEEDFSEYEEDWGCEW